MNTSRDAGPYLVKALYDETKPISLSNPFYETKPIPVVVGAGRFYETKPIVSERPVLRNEANSQTAKEILRNEANSSMCTPAVTSISSREDLRFGRLLAGLSRL